jgi:hypothetical protein
MRAFAPLSYALAITLVGCSETTNTPVTPEPPTTPPPSPVEPIPLPSFRASIYGSEWSANDLTVTRPDESTIRITGVGIEGPWAGYTVTLTLVDAGAPGEYSLAVDGNGSILSISRHPHEWTTQIGSGAGRAVVVSSAMNRLVGAFEGFVDSHGGSGEVLSIFGGTFDVVF